MKIETSALAALSVAGFAWLTASPPALAVNINTHGASCLTQGAYPNVIPVHGGLANFGTSTAFVICGITRSPLAAGAASGGVFVDFLNEGLKTVSCTVSTINFNGTAGMQVSFTAATTTIDKFVSIPAAQLGMYHYLDVTCSLPPGVVLIGVTAVQ